MLFIRAMVQLFHSVKMKCSIQRGEAVTIKRQGHYLL